MANITDAQKRILREARDRGSVNALMQRRRPCECLERLGLLEKTGLMSMQITAAGRAALSSSALPAKDTP